MLHPLDKSAPIQYGGHCIDQAIQVHSHALEYLLDSIKHLLLSHHCGLVLGMNLRNHQLTVRLRAELMLLHSFLVCPTLRVGH